MVDRQLAANILYQEIQLIIMHCVASYILYNTKKVVHLA